MSPTPPSRRRTANVSIEIGARTSSNTIAAAALHGFAGVLGDGRARCIICVVMSCAAARVVRDAGQFLQHHAQFLLHRHHGAGHDRGDRDRRHRPLGRLDHGPGRGLVRPDAARPAIPGGRPSIVGLGGGLRRRPDQRLDHRLSRSLAVRHDARHAGDRALGRGGAVGQPHDLQVRPRRTGVQGSRRRRAGTSRRTSRCAIRCFS